MTKRKLRKNADISPPQSPHEIARRQAIKLPSALTSKRLAYSNL